MLILQFEGFPASKSDKTAEGIFYRNREIAAHSERETGSAFRDDVKKFQNKSSGSFRKERFDVSQKLGKPFHR